MGLSATVSISSHHIGKVMGIRNVLVNIQRGERQNDRCQHISWLKYSIISDPFTQESLSLLIIVCPLPLEMAIRGQQKRVKQNKDTISPHLPTHTSKFTFLADAELAH